MGTDGCEVCETTGAAVHLVTHLWSDGRAVNLLTYLFVPAHFIISLSV